MSMCCHVMSFSKDLMPLNADKKLSDLFQHKTKCAIKSACC